MKLWLPYILTVTMYLKILFYTLFKHINLKIKIYFCEKDVMQGTGNEFAKSFPNIRFVIVQLFSK